VSRGESTWGETATPGPPGFLRERRPNERRSSTRRGCVKHPALNAGGALTLRGRPGLFAAWKAVLGRSRPLEERWDALVFELITCGRSIALPAAMNATSLAQVPPTQTIFSLPRTVGTAAIAIASRGVLLDFVNHADRWNRPELDRWLNGAYRASLVAARRDAFEVQPQSQREGDPARLQYVLCDARTYTVELLKASAQPNGGGLIASDAVQRGLVIACEDRDRERGWLPKSTPEMPLRDRLLALWAVDYLMRSHEYESFLAVCPCGRVSFDAISRLRGGCEGHTSYTIRARWSDSAGSLYRSCFPGSER